MDCNFPKSLRAGDPCARCGYALPFDYETPPRRTCPKRCAYLGAAIGEAVARVACTCPAGTVAEATYRVHACRLLGECLPDFTCTNANKTAVREKWSRSDGGDPYALNACAGCESFAAAAD